MRFFPACGKKKNGKIEKFKMKNARSNSKLLNKIVQIIKRNQKFLIITHDNLDGDSFGSGLALGLALRKMGKDIKFLITTQIPARYDFLPGITKITCKKIDPGKYNVLFVLDTAGWGQMKHLHPDSFKRYTIINIDHHIDNKKFGLINWVDTKASAVGELVYKLLKRLKSSITKDIAVCLYTSIITDTGCFQFQNTTAETHRITADLIQKNISSHTISEQIYERMPLSRLSLLQHAIGSLKLGYHNQIIWTWITQKMLMLSAAKREDTEGFVQFLKAIKGIKVAIIFKEGINKNEKRVTLRSKCPGLYVNKIAHKFNGGGHPAAAGCTVLGGRKEVESSVISAVVDALKNL